MRRSLGAAVLLASGVAVAQTPPPAPPPAKPPAAAPAAPAPTTTAPAPAPSAAPAPTTTAPSAEPAPTAQPETEPAPVAPVLVAPDPAPPPESTPPPEPPPTAPAPADERSAPLPKPPPVATDVPSERAKQAPSEPSAWQDGHALAIEAAARVGGRLGPAAYTARSEERAGLGYEVGAWFTLSPHYVLGFGLARQDLGTLVVSDGASTATAGYASTALELGARAFPFRREGFDVYLGLHVGLGWQDVEASGLTAPVGFEPGRVFACSDMAGPGFGLGAEAGVGLELTRALWLTGTLDASGYRHSADIVGNCVGGIGSVTSLSFGAGLLYAFDLGAERALSPKREARR